MRAPISVVIPTLNAGEDLPFCLSTLGEGLQAGLIRELVVSDGGSSDTTRAIAEEAGAVLVTGTASRGGQVHRGVLASSGQWVWLLHADSRLHPGWSDAVRRHLETRPDKAGWFDLRFDGGGLPGWCVARWANLRARLFGLPFGDQGLLVQRSLYDAVGGAPNIPLMEDVALARALRGRLVRVGAVIATDPSRYHRDGWVRRGSGNLWLQLRYLTGADPERLARKY